MQVNSTTDYEITLNHFIRSPINVSKLSIFYKRQRILVN